MDKLHIFRCPPSLFSPLDTTCAWRIAAAFGEKVFAIPFHPDVKEAKILLDTLAS